MKTAEIVPDRATEKVSVDKAVISTAEVELVLPVSDGGDMQFVETTAEGESAEAEPEEQVVKTVVPEETAELELPEATLAAFVGPVEEERAVTDVLTKAVNIQTCEVEVRQETLEPLTEKEPSPQIGTEDVVQMEVLGAAVVLGEMAVAPVSPLSRGQLQKQETMEILQEELQMDVVATITEEQDKVEAVSVSEVAITQMEIPESKAIDAVGIRRSVLTKQETMEAYHDELKLIGGTILEDPTELDNVLEATYAEDEELLNYEPKQVVGSPAEDRKSPKLQKEHVTDISRDELYLGVDIFSVELSATTQEVQSALLPVVDIDEPDVHTALAAEPPPMEAHRDEVVVVAAAEVAEVSVMETAIAGIDEVVVARDDAFDISDEIHIDTEIVKDVPVLEKHPAESFETVGDSVLHVDVFEISEHDPEESTEEFQTDMVQQSVQEELVASVATEGDEVEITRQTVHAATLMSEGYREEDIFEIDHGLPGESAEVNVLPTIAEDLNVEAEHVTKWCVSVVTKQETMEVCREEVHVDVETIVEDNVEPEVVSGYDTATVQVEIRESKVVDDVDSMPFELAEEPTEACQDELRLIIGETVLEGPKELDHISDSTYVEEEESLKYEVVGTRTAEDGRKSPLLPKQNELYMNVDISYVEMPVSTKEEEHIALPTADIKKPAQPESVSEVLPGEIQLDSVHEVSEELTFVPDAADTAKEKFDSLVELTEQQEVSVPVFGVVIPQDAVVDVVTEEYANMRISAEEFVSTATDISDSENLESKPAVDAETSEQATVVLPADTVTEVEESSPVIDEDVTIDIMETKAAVDVSSVESVTITNVEKLPESTLGDLAQEEWREETTAIANEFVEERVVAIDDTAEEEESFRFGFEITTTLTKQTDYRSERPEAAIVVESSDLITTGTITETADASPEVVTKEEQLYQPELVIASESIPPQVEEIDTSAAAEVQELIRHEPLELHVTENFAAEGTLQTEVSLDATETAATAKEFAKEIEVATDDTKEKEYGFTVEEEESSGFGFEFTTTRPEQIDDKVQRPDAAVVGESSEVKPTEMITETTRASSEVEEQLYHPELVTAADDITSRVEESSSAKVQEVITHELSEALVTEPLADEGTRQTEVTLESTVTVSMDTSYPKVQHEAITAWLESPDEVFKESVDSSQRLWESRVEELSDQQKTEEEKEMSTSDEWSVVEKLPKDAEEQEDEDYGFSVEEEESFGYGFEYTRTERRHRTKMVRLVSEDGEIIEKRVVTDKDEDDDEESSVASSRRSSVSDSGDVGADIAGITVYVSTVEGEPDVETELNEYEDVLPDGTIVRRRVMSTRCRQTVTKRVVLEGLDDDDSPFDDVVRSLSPVEGLPADDTSCRLMTRYSDRSTTDPELSTEVEQSEDSLRDGSRVQKRTTTRRSQQLTTERLVVAGTRLFVEGGADDEDEVFENLKRIGSPTSLTGTSRMYILAEYSCSKIDRL